MPNKYEQFESSDDDDVPEAGAWTPPAASPATTTSPDFGGINPILDANDPIVDTNEPTDQESAAPKVCVVKGQTNCHINMY